MSERKFNYRLDEADEEALSKLLEPFGSLNEYIDRLEQFKLTYAANDDCELNEDVLEWVYEEIDKLKMIQTTIAKDDMDMVRMVFDRTIGKYHYDNIIEGLKEENDYYVYINEHPERTSA